MSKQLNEPITENGIRITNFFNGRLLTANDLKTDQEAGRSQRWQLGRAIGDGIIEGFEVNLISAGTPTTLPVVGVTRGLAINRKGQTLSLPNDDQVTLRRRIDLPPPEAGLFGECGVLTSTFSNLDKGAYVLVVAPVSAFREKAPMRNVEPNNAIAGCGNKYAVEGVQFELIKIDINSMTSINPTTRTEIEGLMNAGGDLSLSRLRNLLANLCFGTEELLDTVIDPFRQASGRPAFATYGAVDFMRSRGEVTDCKVPLALVYWAGGSVRFLDMWSARRRVFVTGNSSSLSHFFNARRLAEAEARFYQFHEHVRWIIGLQANPTLLVAAEAFRFLPAAGLVPLRSGRSPAGVLSERFFFNKRFGPPTTISGDKLQSLFHESLFHRSLDLSKQEFVQLYLVAENSAAQTDFVPPPPYVVFAGQYLPYLSDQPRFAGLCQTLRDCREAYHELMGKPIFFPVEATTGSIPSRVAVNAAIGHVAQYADQRFVATCKGGCVIGFEQALDLLRDLYTAQKALVDTFLFDWAGLPDKAVLQDFANRLHTFLDVGTPSSKPSLNQALTVRDLNAAIEAQDVINRMAQGFTGGVVVTTSGNLQVIFQPTAQGSVLVLGSATAVNYVFRVRNLTNQAADVVLSANFLAPHVDWDSFIAGVTEMNGDPITSIPLQPGEANPTNPGSFRDVQVSLVTPTDATRSDTTTLRLTARAPSINRSNFDQVALTFGDAPVTGTPTTVRFSSLSPVTSRPVNQGRAGTPMTLRYDATFHTDQPTPTKSFIFHVIVTTTATRRFYNIGFTDRIVDASSTGESSMDIFTLPFNLTSDAMESITVRVIPSRDPSTGGLPGPLTFTARLQSVDDPTVSVDQAVTITTTT
jgi:hypothetical protein